MIDVLSFDMKQPFDFDPSRVLAALLNATGDAVFIADMDGRIRGCTPAAETLLGYDADRLAGRDVSEVLQAGHGVGIQRVIEQVRQKQAVEPYDACLISHSGQL